MNIDFWYMMPWFAHSECLKQCVSKEWTTLQKGLPERRGQKVNDLQCLLTYKSFKIGEGDATSCGRHFGSIDSTLSSNARLDSLKTLAPIAGGAMWGCGVILSVLLCKFVPYFTVNLASERVQCQ